MSRAVKASDLLEPTVGQVLRAVRNWWLNRAERHYLMCADVEAQRAREHQANIAYYQKRAAMARSNRI
jgi:hypothetical protein